jgi:peptidyl-prolyl cis-trans isomerase SurA
MKTSTRSFMIALLALGVIGVGKPAALADSSIRVLVNDKPITSFDIAQRARLIALTGGKGGEKVATEELINQILQVREARKRGIVITDARVDAALSQIGQGMKMTLAQLKQALGSQGVGMDTLRERIRAQIAWTQVVQARARVDVSVKPSDVTAALMAKGSPDKLTVTEYTLQQIIFVVPKGSSSGYIAQRRREAESYRGRFAGCDTSVAQAKTLKNVAVRNMGRRTSAELTGEDGEEVQRTPAGKTTRPHQTPQGIELVAVCTTRELQSNAAARSQVEMQLTMEQSKDLGKEYLAELREKAIIQFR